MRYLYLTAFMLALAFYGCKKEGEKEEVITIDTPSFSMYKAPNSSLVSSDSILNINTGDSVAFSPRNFTWWQEKAVWTFQGVSPENINANDNCALVKYSQAGQYSVILTYVSLKDTTQKKSITKTNCIVVTNKAPVLTTFIITNITQSKAWGGGSVTDDGGSPVTARGVCWGINENPTIADNKSTDGNGTGSYGSDIIGLTANTTYYVRAYATNSIGTGYGTQQTFKTLATAIVTGTVTDVEGNVYKTVKIGDQTWMAENLKTTKYNDGMAIINITDNYDWTMCTVTDMNTGEVTTKAAYCWYNNDAATYKDTYGALYNWHVVNSGKLCPTGWHIPSDAEWVTLETYLGGASVASGKLKEVGNSHWLSENTDATNSSGFLALPGGIRDWGGDFSSIGIIAYWWSSTSEGTVMAWHYGIAPNNGIAYYPHGYKNTPSGLSVRCIED